MEQDSEFSEIAHPPSVFRLFNHNRTDPDLPSGYKWTEQKKLYCPRTLLNPHLPGPFKPAHKFGHVFCHRGLYERASGIVDNSVAAVENGIHHGLFLHEVDVFVLEQLEKAFVAHDKNPSRVTSKGQPWGLYPTPEIFDTGLVTRGVERGARNPDLTSKQSDFASSYLETDGKIPSLYDIMWRESQEPSGITLQVDLREQDFAKALAYYSYHISKLSLLHKDRQGVHRSKGWELFRSTVLKGYNKHYRSFSALHEDVEKKSVEAYGSNHFEIRHLHVFPPLIMVFYSKYLVQLARETPPVDGPQGDRDSYEHIRQTFMDQVLSFVGVGVNSYNFILEIVHSGLGLGYDIVKKTAINPLNGEPLKDKGVIFDSRVDRAMIDVSLALRRRYPDLLFSSCTRLPDVITPEGKYKAWHETSRLVPWNDGEKGLEAKLRAIHGGLYPQCQLVVADDPAAEIAARTWIDQTSGLDRSRLMDMTYDEWLSEASDDVVAAITKINNQDFMPNKFGHPTTPGASAKKRDRTIELNTKVRSWLEAVLSPKPVLSNLDDGNQYSADEHRQSAGSKGKQATADSQLSIISDDDRHREGTIFAWKNKPRGHFSRGTSSDPIILRVWGKEYLFENVVDVQRSLASMAAYKAAEEGNEQTVRNLLNVGANIDASTGLYGTPLAAACRNGHGTVVKLLLDADADIHMCRSSGTPLELAASGGHRDVVEMLLAVMKRQQADYKNSGKLSSGTALHKASWAGHEAVVALLLDSGADINFQEGVGLTALEQACVSCQTNVINLLLARDADFKDCGRIHGALEWACHKGDLRVATLLLSKGAVVDFPLDAAFTPEIVSLLVKHNPDVRNLPQKRLSESGLKTTRDIGRAPGDDALTKFFKKSSLRVRKRRKPASSGPVKQIAAPLELRDCGCLLCFVDQKVQPDIERQMIDSYLWEAKMRKTPPATINDPVSVTLGEMGKLTQVGHPEEMRLAYKFESPTQ